MLNRSVNRGAQLPPMRGKRPKAADVPAAAPVHYVVSEWSIPQPVLLVGPDRILEGSPNANVTRNPSLPRSFLSLTPSVRRSSRMDRWFASPGRSKCSFSRVARYR